MAQIAHTWDEKQRTKDVEVDQHASFDKMLLSDDVMRGLRKNGFVIPSPIQLRAIPLGRCGMDLLVQAKSGTGKTLVFSVIILEMYSRQIEAPQSLVLAPTREIAIQIESILAAVGKFCPNFKVGSFIGGIGSVADDRITIQGCRAVVGTPGRIRHLIANNILNMAAIKLLVLDEADKLMASTFQNDFNNIFSALQSQPQVVALSATYDSGLDKELAVYMRNPVRVSPKRDVPILLGVKQFVYEIESQPNTMKDMLAKIDALKNIFSHVPFKQSLAFSNSQSRAESFSNYLNESGWPAEVISGGQDQKRRLAVMRKLREFKCRILVATDLMARGIDVAHVNLIVNIEVPTDSATYLHRVGRAGRFGSHGIAVTLISSDAEMKRFRYMLGTIGGNKMTVLKFPATNINDTIWSFDNRDEEQYRLGTVSGIVKETEDVQSSTQTESTTNVAQLKSSKNGLPMENIDPVALLSKLLIDPTPKKSAHRCTHSFDAISKEDGDDEKLVDTQSRHEAVAAINQLLDDSVVPPFVAQLHKIDNAGDGIAAQRRQFDCVDVAVAVAAYEGELELNSDTNGTNIGTEHSSGFDESSESTDSNGIYVKTNFHDSDDNGENNNGDHNHDDDDNDDKFALTVEQDGLSDTDSDEHSQTYSNDSDSKEDSSESSDNDEPVRYASQTHASTDATTNSTYNQMYHTAYSTWTNQFWNQTVQIMDYVKFSRYIRENDVK